MNNDVESSQRTGLEHYTFPDKEKESLDLVILKYMAHRIYIILCLHDQSTSAPQPLLYYSDEGQNHVHRIAIYRPRDLLLNNDLAFVGFVSGRLVPGNPLVAQEIQRVDKQLVAELASASGVLSYSSLEVHDGNWCNLVLLSGEEAKAHFRNNQTHAYAAYELSPCYYEWVRLHHGVMPGGLARNHMILQKTRYYGFQGTQHEPTIWERVYYDA